MTLTAGKKLRRRIAKQQQQLRAQATNCPTPEKHHYLSEQEADEALTATWGNQTPGRMYAVRAYQCECGHWHHTKRPGWGH